MDVVAILGKRKQKLESLRVMLSGERPEHGYPKPWTAIHVEYVLSGQLETKYVEEAINESMAKFCSVSATLRPGVEITHSYRIVR
jgi:putative redox protein